MLRLGSLICLVCLLVPTSSMTVRADDDRRRSLEKFEFVLTEFRLKSGPKPEQSAKDIISAFQNRKGSDAVELIETVRVSTVSEMETMVQLQRQSHETVGFRQTGNQRSRSTQTFQLGTQVQVIAKSEGEKVIADLSYESSRFQGEGAEDAPPEIATVTIQTTLLIERGAMELLSGNTRDQSTFVVVSVR